MTDRQRLEEAGPDPEEGTRNPEAAAADVELHAWAEGHGVVYQSAQNMIIVHGGVHDHYHSGRDEFERTGSPATGEVSPYPGLRAYGMDEAEWFFGREKLIGRLKRRLDLCLTDHSPLAVVAPSGAGKSSLLRAGLLPELAKGQLDGSRHWPQLLLTPTAHPLAALASGLAQVAKLTKADEQRVSAAMEGVPGSLAALVRELLQLPPGGRLVLVVDQMEELFTLCRDESVRRRFVDVLAALTGTETPVALAVYGLRADAYGDCAAFPHLRDALVDCQVIVGPMTDEEVRRAVTSPAEQSGLKFAPGLVDVILRDLRGTAPQDDGAYEAGRLPLLAHALRATWLERRGDTLTVGGYRSTGGIDGAVAATAEEEFGKLTSPARKAARLLFLGLVTIGENGEVTRRRRTRPDLLMTAADPKAVPELVERFTRARLLTQGVEREKGTVEVTHEALLRAWPRLRTWIGADSKSGVPVRQELERAATEWEHGGRKDVTTLYRGARLELARSWASEDGNEDLAPLVTDFLSASRRQQRRTQLLKRGAVALTVVLALLASGLAWFAFDQRHDALAQRDNAIFDRVTAEADRQRETQGALAAQLDLVAYRMRPTAALRTRLMQEAGSVVSTALPGQFGTVHSIAFGPDGRLATGGDALRLWNASDPAHPTSLTSPIKGRAGSRLAPAYSTKGHLLAVGAGDGTIQILDVSDAGHPVALSAWVQVSRGPVPSLRFSPDNRTLALASTVEAADGTQTGTVQLWSVADPRHPRRLSTVLSVRGQYTSSIAFSPDGATLVVGGGTFTGGERAQLLRLWDVSDPAHPTALGAGLGGHNNIVNQVAYSPVGQVMASAGGDGSVLVWDVSKPRQPKQVRRLLLNSSASSVAFSPDGRILATGDNSGNVYLWNVGAPASTRTLYPALRGHTAIVMNLAFDTTGHTLASGGGDGKVLLWRLPPTLAVTGAGQAVSGIALTGDGRLLAVASGTHVTLWNVSDPARLTRVGDLPQFRSTVDAVAFRTGKSEEPGQTLLATGDGAGGVRLWDVSAPAHPVEAGTVLPSLTKQVGGLAFDATGHTLLASAVQLQGGFIGGLRAWDVSDPARPVALGGNTLGGQERPVMAMAAAPQGEYIYSGDYYRGNIRVWRTSDGTVPSMVGQLDSGQIIFALAADPRGRLIATGNADSTVRLWDVSRPRSPAAVGKPLVTGGIVNSVAFAPDGGLLASGNAIGQIRLWDTSDPAHVTAYGLPVSDQVGAVVALRFSPRAGVLIAGGGDGSVRLWQTDPARARTLLCASTRGAMNKASWKEYVSPDLPYDPPCGA